MNTKSKTKPRETEPKMSFEKACRLYVHRFTMEHIPLWADRPATNGRYCAPQYRSDREWYENTLFPPHNPYSVGRQDECYSAHQSFPLGLWLDAPYRTLRRREGERI